MSALLFVSSVLSYQNIFNKLVAMNKEQLLICHNKSICFSLKLFCKFAI